VGKEWEKKGQEVEEKEEGRQQVRSREQHEERIAKKSEQLHKSYN
jgi:hypothetical protein